LKYLVIAALLALLLLLLYSRIHPYLKILGKILGTIRTIAGSQTTGSAGVSSSAKGDGRLVRCVACGTWVPAERAVGLKSNLAAYCSSECLEKTPVADRRKAAS
jgi:hypothetical protein